MKKGEKMKSFENSCGEISVSFTVGTYEYAIPNLKKLEKIDRHNNRKYYVSYKKELDLSLSKHNILLKGTNNLVEDVKKLYKDEFDEAVLKYNEKQTREDRKISDYFEKICNDKQKNIAIEIILQIGDTKDWENIPLEDRKKMADVFLNGTAIINSRGLKVTHSILHLDESTPHCHLIVIPIAKGFKIGMEKQVSTRQILDKTRLAMLRGLLFKELLKKFNKVFDCNKTLKKGSELTEHLSMKDYKKYMTEALVCETI
jgi:plasmid recombination enzyme